MKPHYFEQRIPDADDRALAAAIERGDVPPGCMLGGSVVQGMLAELKDPCTECRGPRHRCAGRPYGSSAKPKTGTGPLPVAPPPDDAHFFFCGVDGAPSESHRSDDGAIVISCAVPHAASLAENAAAIKRGEIVWSDNWSDWWFDFVYAERLTHVQRASARQYSGRIHQLHQAFGFSRICMDPNGGGTFIQRELKAVRQIINGVETEVTPIADQDSGPRDLGQVGQFILHLFKRGDPGIEALWPKLPGDDNLNDALYSLMRTGVDSGHPAWPGHPRDLAVEQPDLWKSLVGGQREALQTLHLALEQFKNISVAVAEDGETMLLTRRNARQFVTTGKKDLVSASMFSYLAFMIWLRAEDWRLYIKPENRTLFGGTRVK